MDSRGQLKTVLDKLYVKYNRRELIAPDPLQFVYRYESNADREIVGLLSAGLAYGRVAQIGKSLEKLLGVMGASPYEFVAGFGKRGAGKLAGFKHRFNTAEDIADLLSLLKKVLKKHGSIEAYFLMGYSPEDENILPALSSFCGGLEKMHGVESSGLKYLLSNPSRGSACKRMNLYLRWMVRDDDVDCGVWKGVDKAKLIVPIDVHMGRLCKILGMYEQKTVSLKAANRARAVKAAEPMAKPLPMAAVVLPTASSLSVR